MLNRIFPATIDHRITGHWAALWLLLPIVLMRLMMGLNSVFNTEWVVRNADKIPIERYGAEAADTVISLFGAIGVAHLVLASIGLLAIFRYRGLIPFVYLLFLLDFFAKQVTFLLRPEISSDPSTVNVIGLILGSLMITGFALSLWPARRIDTVRERR